MKTLLALGFGYSARAIVSRLDPKAWRLIATSTSSEGAARLKQRGLDGFVFDGRAPNSDVSNALQLTTHLLLSAPPGDNGDPLLAQHRVEVERAPNLQWIGYLSTIGVYGNRNGEWVDETDTPEPSSQRSRRRLAAEQDWLRTGDKRGCTCQIFRLAGIYGPGRSAIEKVQAGTARSIIKPGQVFNRIHVDDIATTVERAIAGHGTESIYNVTDNEPAPPQDVVAYAADLLRQPPPPCVNIDEAGLSEMGRSFYTENKRVRNHRIKNDLGVQLRYPTYREGLAGILSGH
jgi:dTDP-4-dehydrorhamnose reductase